MDEQRLARHRPEASTFHFYCPGGWIEQSVPNEIRMKKLAELVSDECAEGFSELRLQMSLDEFCTRIKKVLQSNRRSIRKIKKLNVKVSQQTDPQRSLNKVYDEIGSNVISDLRKLGFTERDLGN